ncbi:hypothetical protein LINPERHAP2_LOCUS20673 [Linum perenne]
MKHFHIRVVGSLEEKLPKFKILKDFMFGFNRGALTMEDEIILINSSTK